ncbi:hypothetical protein IV203_033632 [Nitzschia inconspicua]|uniref:Protein kinase domain-containing protein n=2 Tax=Nitzschia inconspicua TaxID=303405 RepID=A0A9K3M270_9STRA|nr:hypothetical protein IV203_033632 [Nitzschia inconspicua]
MSSDELRTKCQEAYEQEISDELWQEVTNTQIWKMTESPDLAVLLFLEHVRKGEMQKKYQTEMAEKEEMEKKYQTEMAEKDKKYQTEMAEKDKKYQTEIAKLQAKLMNFEQQKQHQQERKPLYVSGVSQAAKHSVFRQQFRERQVAENNCRGGFVTHELFIEFVKAAHVMTNSEAPRNNELTGLKLCMKNVKSQLDKKYGNVLLNRVQHSLYSAEYKDEEVPQSALAAEMLQFAITRLQQQQSQGGTDDTPETGPSLIISHQFAVVSTLDPKSTETVGIPTKKPKESESTDASLANSNKKRKATGSDNASETLPPQSEGGSVSRTGGSKKVLEVDILCWFSHPVEQMGSCCLASVEYKPSKLNSEVREGQADMYASNIQILHKKPCLSIDIAGGNNIQEWTISVYALVKRPQPDDDEPLWDKSRLYQGNGTAAIVRVASGLLAALPNYPKQTDNFGYRLGPVVGLVDNRVFKAYDNATTRKPNIDLIQEYVDKQAKLWTSDDEKIQIIEMCYHENTWTNPTSVKAFISILKTLSMLHSKDLVHGDIRLANLLSSGHIVDFDFVGLKTYPEGLMKLGVDGRRHEDVDEAISTFTIQKMKPEKQHDAYSMAQVMTLFTARGPWWENAFSLVENGNIDDAIEILRKHESQVLTLNAEISFYGTGPSPVKRNGGMCKTSSKSAQVSWAEE